MPGLDEQSHISSVFNSTAPVYLKPAQAALDQHMKQTGQFTIIHDNGGTGHNVNDSNPEDNPLNSLTFLTDPQTASVLAQNGVKNLALEIRHEFQPLVDKVAAGQMSPQQYAEGIAAMYKAAGDGPGSVPSSRAVEEGKVIQAMAQNGIKILCVENQASNLKIHGAMTDERAAVSADYDAIGRDEGMQAAMKRMQEVNDPDYFRNAPQELIKIMEQSRIEALSSPEAAATALRYKRNTEDRLNYDTHLAHQIKIQADGGKTVVYYGAVHGAYKGDLDENLDGAKKIMILPNEMAIKVSMQTKSMENMQPPDAAIALDTGAAYSSQQLNNFVLKDAGHLPQAFTPNLGQP